jgi:hypothetical protein
MQAFARNRMKESLAMKIPFAELVASYVDDPRFIRRVHLEQMVLEAVGDPGNQLTLITGEPGVGKSALAASLARQHPSWLQYFLRRDSVTKITGGDATSLLLSVGHQLASRHPEAFQPQHLEIVVRQRIGTVSAGGAATGIRIEDLRASPFMMTSLGVDQYADVIDGILEGVAVGSATLEPRLLAPPELQYLALIDPANVLAVQDPAARVVLLIDALDEAATGDWPGSILTWLRQLPELPPNVRFVVTSRPGALDSVGRHPASLREIRIDGGMPGVREDLASYAQQLMTMIPAGITGNHDSVPTYVVELVNRADGNFAYLAAFARAVDSAVDACVSGGQRLGGLSRLMDFRGLGRAVRALRRACPG